MTIPATVTIDGITYKVTAIAAKAFQNNKKITKVTIKRNIRTIGKKAFYGCKKLNSITITTKLLTRKTVGNKVFTGLPKNAIVKLPKSKLNVYKKLLKKKGLSF